MISGGSVEARRQWALLLAASLLAPGPGSAAESDSWDIKRLMHELAQIKSSSAHFVERKHVALLNAPLESSGTLIYTAPGRLERHTRAPRQESLVLEQDRVTFESLGRKRSFALRDYPVVRAFVESIRSTLAGDLATLHRYYQVALDGSERQWRLTLKPLEPEMQDVVTEIRIGGTRNRVGAIEIIEAQGDRSLMTITGEAP